MSNPLHPWFRRGRIGAGYGAIPTCWQGWAVLAVWTTFVVGLLVWFLDEAADGTRLAIFAAGAFGASIVALLVCFAKTPGRWRWGEGDPL